ncbi:platelet endothelial aggregation receptor 1-like [Haliotis rubra]|uniref:platelet endothelial aggregation receptor 1-like n=1 Tax=Haliotis rubra TaxID=36100 RepID=UPI001EE5B410|nr:platelet endothelial aggregation receptor 1-like [Haliotis rubra]
MEAFNTGASWHYPEQQKKAAYFDGTRASQRSAASLTDACYVNTLRARRSAASSTNMTKPRLQRPGRKLRVWYCAPVKKTTLFTFQVEGDPSYASMSSCASVVMRGRQALSRNHQRDESILTERSGQVETGEYYQVHRYWDIGDYDEVSQRQGQQKRPVEEEDYEEVSQQQRQHQGQAEEEDYDEVSQQQEQQEGPAEEEDNSDPALPALADYFPGPHGSEDDDSNSVLPVLADYFPSAPGTGDNNGALAQCCQEHQRHQFSSVSISHVPRQLKLYSVDRTAMDIQVILIVVLTLLSTQADKCMEDQQCTNCSSTTQYCSTDCFSGYFGLRCKSRCSNQCIKSKCSQTLRGTISCSDGCVPGFYGTRCIIPCTLPTKRCTKCPQGCDGTFCDLTTSCVSGCHDQYYGTNCRNCSPRCRHCNRITGRCDVCHDPYHGLDCEYSCEHCSTTDCVQTCAPGLYGRTCSLRCHKDCLSNPTTITNDSLTTNTSHTCISECQRYSGECINGCADDWSGPHCSSPNKCNPNCFGCNETGACVEGCLSGYYGGDCKPCPRTCFNNTCYQNNGSCDNGCIQGQYGQSCQLSCIHCPGGACHPGTGICDSVPMNDAKIGTATALFVLVLGIIVAGCIFHFKRVSAKREESHQMAHTRPQSDPNRQGIPSRRFRNSEHIYSDVNEDETGPVIVFL